MTAQEREAAFIGWLVGATASLGALLFGIGLREDHVVAAAVGGGLVTPALCALLYFLLSE